MFYKALKALKATAKFITNKAENKFSSGKTLDSTDNTPLSTQKKPLILIYKQSLIV
jgi:hypothetical protein